jgi:hypothetical protein
MSQTPGDKMSIRKLLVASFVFWSARSLASAYQADRVLYYSGKVHYTDLSADKTIPDQDIILKKELLSSAGALVETATMLDYRGIIADLKTTVTVNGKSVSAKSADGSAVGTGYVEGPDWDWTYLNIDFVIASTGARVKNINYMTPKKLIARKEVGDASGKPSLLWEADLSVISETDYQALYKKMHQGN